MPELAELHHVPEAVHFLREWFEAKPDGVSWFVHLFAGFAK